MKKAIILCVSTFFFMGCKIQQTTTYQKIEVLKNEYNSSRINKIQFGKSFNPTEIIFSKLDKQLKYSDVIYIFSWVNNLPMINTHDFKALILNINTGEQFYINNSKKEYKNIIISNKSEEFLWEKSLLNIYLTKNEEYLNGIKSAKLATEFSEEYYLFDTRKEKCYLLENIVFMNGQPYLPIMDLKN